MFDCSKKLRTALTRLIAKNDGLSPLSKSAIWQRAQSRLSEEIGSGRASIDDVRTNFTQSGIVNFAGGFYAYWTPE
jgi:hypothetical protein